MTSKRQIAKQQQMIVPFRKKFNIAIGNQPRNPQLIKELAWEVTEGEPDWKRRVVYGNIMKRQNIPMKKTKCSKSQVDYMLDRIIGRC